MAEQRRENSLLVSLRELRSIEEDRVKEEEDAVRSRREAEERARQDEIRRAKEVEEAKIRDAADKVRREKDEKERQLREEQLRLEEAERRARIEAQAKLEEARIQAEAQIRVSKQPPVRLIVGITLGVLVLAGGTVGYIVNQNREEQRRMQAENDERLAQERKRAEATQAALAAEQRGLQLKLTKLMEDLKKATSEVDREKIRRQMEAEKAESQKRTERVKKPGKPENKMNTSDTDPLGNLPGMN